MLAPLVAGCEPAPELARFPIRKAMELIPDKGQRTAFRKTFDRTGSLEEIGLEYSDSAGQAPKTVRVALWAFRQVLKTPKAGRGPQLFMRIIEEVALCGRGATEHAAIAGAVAGAALGLSGLPPGWVAGLPEAAWLESEVSAFVAALAP